MACNCLISHWLEPVKYFIGFQRQVVCSAIVLEKSENSKLNFENAPRKKFKVTVVRRSFPPCGEKPVTKEWKTASSVVKKFNWENKYLFGPVQSSKTNSYNDAKIDESNQIIQHRTLIPIVEPHEIQENALEANLICDKCDSKPSMDLEFVLEFPLMNKSESSSQNFNIRIGKYNVLRKYLEHLKGRMSIPSVSLILEKTMPPERVDILKRWKQSMIKELGEEGFKKYQSELLANGSSLHGSINNYLASTPGADVIVKDENFGHWKSLQAVFPEINQVKLLEEHILHPFLYYRGVLDCFAMYKGKLVVIDWKTSKKAKLSAKSLYDNPLQIAAYIGALNFDPKFQYLANKGLIVVAYENGAPATVHFINESAMQQYWNQWLKRVKLFWENIKLSKES